MIHYQLRCPAGHGFEGWFRDAVGFEEQAAGGLLACPECGSGSVTRALMAPAVRSSGRRRVAAPPSPEAAPVSPPDNSPERTAAILPDRMRAVLQRMRSEIEQHCEDVGDRFAEVAREMHRRSSGDGEPGAVDRAGKEAVPPRGIYGEATSEEYEALADEGIEVNRIPWLPRADG